MRHVGWNENNWRSTTLVRYSQYNRHFSGHRATLPSPGFACNIITAFAKFRPSLVLSSICARVQGHAYQRLTSSRDLGREVPVRTTWRFGSEYVIPAYRSSLQCSGSKYGIQPPLYRMCSSGVWLSSTVEQTRMNAANGHHCYLQSLNLNFGMNVATRRVSLVARRSFSGPIKVLSMFDAFL
jgi:hypothetical protein